MAAAEPDRWLDALLAAELLAHDPQHLRGCVVRGAAGPVRDFWLQHFRRCLAPGVAVRRLPAGVGDERLIGSLDLSATLSLGRPVAERGLLAEIDGGVLIVPMAERMADAVAARLVAALDRGVMENAFGVPQPARFALVLLDEGAADERSPAALLDRLAFHIDLDGLRPDMALEAEQPLALADAVPGAAVLDDGHAGALLGDGHAETLLGDDHAETLLGDDHAESLCAVADAFAIASIRAPMLAAKAGLAAASMDGRAVTGEADVLVAARLVLAPRATRLPPAEEPPVEPQPPQQQPGDQPDTPQETSDRAEDEAQAQQALTDLVVEATRAALPAGLMAALEAGRPPRGSAMGGRGAGALRKTPRNGRRAGVRSGLPRNGARLDLVETLKVAAPWQVLRRRESPDREGVLVRRDDFRIRKLVKRSESTTIFVVDASGSAAIARLGEAKGAIELLLAEAYVRRDEVALIAFRGEGAEVLLPPTRSLPRARRRLCDLAGGGGTPLAAAIEAADVLAAAVRSKGRTPLLVFLTDGRANIARDGSPGGARALDEALVVSRRIRAAELATVFIDTAARPRAEGPGLAAAMGARYVALPRVEAGAVCAAVKAAR